MGFIHSFVVIIGLGRLSFIFIRTYHIYTYCKEKVGQFKKMRHMSCYTIYYPHSTEHFLIFVKPAFCWYYARINFPLRLNEQFSFIISFSLDRRGAAIRAPRSKTELNLSEIRQNNGAKQRERLGDTVRTPRDKYLSKLEERNSNLLKYNEI